MPQPHLRVHAVNIYVRDQDRSLRFYLDQLGFNLAFDAKLGSQGRWVAVAPPDGSAILLLIRPKPKTQEAKMIGRATQVSFVTEDVLAKYREWRKRGVAFSHAPRLRRFKTETAPGEPAPAWGATFTRFKDVDGNSFALVGFDEVSRQLEAQRRATAQKLEAERSAAQELEIARQVQARLFPQSLPPCSSLDYSGSCVQARHVGGDYYDFLQVGRQRLGIVIADIAGKGIAGALLMANLQANLRSQCGLAQDPDLFLRSVNRLFFESTAASAYATLFYAEYHEETGKLRYANCGHLCGLLFRRGGRMERLQSTCPVVGLLDPWYCAVEERVLRTGDTLALYTDGVTEALNPAEEEYGEERLVEALQRHRRLDAREMVASVVGEVRQYSRADQYDDITLIVARRR